MKRFLVWLLVFAGILALPACGMVRLDENATVKLIAKYEPMIVDVTLEGEEAERVLFIIDNSLLYPDSGTPACGFDEGYGIQIGDRMFSMPWDGCNTLKDISTDLYLNVSEGSMEYFHSLFQKYR